MVSTDVTSLVHRFYQLQAERLDTYLLFDQGHEAYLRTAPQYDFDHYRQLVHEVTKAFAGISAELLDMKTRLGSDLKRDDLAGHIARLQGEEKQKLELTARLQLVRQQVQDRPEEEEDLQEQIQGLKQEIIRNKEALSEIMQDFKYDSED